MYNEQILKKMAPWKEIAKTFALSFIRRIRGNKNYSKKKKSLNYLKESQMHLKYENIILHMQ